MPAILIALLRQFLAPAAAAVFSLLRAVPLFVWTAVAVFVAMILFYEGIGPWRPLPGVSIGIAGRVDRIRDEERRSCEAERARSAKQAREDDQARQLERSQAALEQLSQANARTIAAKQQFESFKQESAREDAEATEAGHPVSCRPTPRGNSRLQPRDLPYPDPHAP